MIRNAGISDDGLYRWVLGRQWTVRPGATFDLWVMLNPSTADGQQDDPTIRRCIGFSQRWGADGLRVVNLYALRATDPGALLDHPDPVGPNNDHVLRVTAEVTRSTGGRIIAAWGAHPMAAKRAPGVLKLLRGKPVALGLTKAGAPRHPLYVRGDAETIPYLAKEAA